MEKYQALGVHGFEPAVANYRFCFDCRFSSRLAIIAITANGIAKRPRVR